MRTLAIGKRAEVARQPPSPPDPQPAPDDVDGIDLELVCTSCGLLTSWRVGEPFPTCSRCED
jgi:hypothetical protein